MDCAVTVGAAILGKIGEYTVAPVGRHLSYLVYYNRNVTNLETQSRQLRNAKDRLHHAVDEAARNAEGIEADVEEWLSKVNETINAADGSIQQYQVGASNLGHCNIVSRYQSSRKAAKMAREIHEMKEDQVTKCNRISYRLTLQCAFRNKLYQEYQSRKETFNDVVAALRDPKFSMVVLYGTGGVGKTMLAEEIARWTLEHNLFSTAIMVSISHSVDVERVQREIAERLGLTLTERALRTRAERIQRRLEQEKEILLILDDIWVKFALADVGISFDDDQRGCKILVTSRFQHLLFDDHIDATINFQVGLLSDAEAENLFNKIVGNSVDHPEFKVLAPKIIKECACLPITITMVASALRNKNLTVWNEALRQLRSSIITGIQGMEESVYKNIRLSYDLLKSEEELLLLFCSLREEDAWSSFPMLFKYAMGWSLFQDVYKLEETRDRVYALLNELQARSLLKEIQDADCVKVHHIVRHVALSIASKEMKMHHVKNAGELKRLSRINKLKDSVVIFICDDHDHERLPERLECPNLKFLFISIASFPDQFFEETKMLRALDMTCAGFERLPSSICSLQNLRMLCIWGCHRLQDVVLVAELKNLEQLTIAYSSIPKVPKQLGRLIRLQSLVLDYCSHLSIIESNVISNLINLEELNLEGDRICWAREGVHGESSNASLTDVKNLAQLTTLYLTINDANILPEDFFSEKLERYRILIGYTVDDSHFKRYKTKNDRTLQLCLSERKLLKEKNLEVLLKNSQVLYLEGLEGVRNFAFELDTQGFQQTKCLILQNNKGIQYMVNSFEQTYPCSAFQSLEFLRLRSMVKLEKICHGDLAPESFTNLKLLQVFSCDKFRNLFHYSIAKCLSLLEKIQVSDCVTLEEIVINEGQIFGSEIIFPQLRFLEL